MNDAAWNVVDGIDGVDVFLPNFADLNMSKSNLFWVCLERSFFGLDGVKPHFLHWLPSSKLK